MAKTKVCRSPSLKFRKIFCVLGKSGLCVGCVVCLCMQQHGQRYSVHVVVLTGKKMGKIDRKGKRLPKKDRSALCTLKNSVRDMKNCHLPQIVRKK